MKKLCSIILIGILAVALSHTCSVIYRDNARNSPAIVLQAPPATVLEKVETACRQASRLNFSVNLPLPTEGQITGIDLVLLSDTKDIQKMKKKD